MFASMQSPQCQSACLKRQAFTVPLQVFKGLQAEPFVRSVAWDPEGQFLVAVTASGLLQIWDLNDGFKMVHTKKQAAPKVPNPVLLMRDALQTTEAKSARLVLRTWWALGETHVVP